MGVLFPTLSGEIPDAHGTVLAWLVADGASVYAGQLVADVCVGEDTGQVAAPTDGVLRRGIPEGGVCQQGTILATIE